jgi:hypothetical protein
MIILTEGVLAKIRDEAHYLAALPGFEAAAWVIVDPQGQYKATWGVTAHRREGISILTEDLVTSAYEENGGQAGSGVILMHNHPAQARMRVLPSGGDIKVMESLDIQLPKAGVELVDFLIVADRAQGFSWRDCQADGSWPQIKEAVRRYEESRRAMACSR